MTQHNTQGTEAEALPANLLGQSVASMIARGSFAGLARELSDETSHQLKKSTSGLNSVYIDSIIKRALVPWTGSAGGFLVGTGQPLPGFFTAPLRPVPYAIQLGATIIEDVDQSSIGFIPGFTSDPTSVWKTPGMTLTPSDPGLGQNALAMQTIITVLRVDKELFKVSPILQENLLISLLRGQANEIDRVLIAGSGTQGEPLGILNTPGVNSVTFGAAATWAKVVSFETSIALKNVAPARVGYLTSPATREKWKLAPRATNSSSYVWEGNSVNGYLALATKQVPSEKVIYANWMDAYVIVYKGVELLVNPYTRGTSGQVDIILSQPCDVAIVHPESFTVSTDSGAQ